MDHIPGNCTEKIYKINKKKYKCYIGKNLEKFQMTAWYDSADMNDYANIDAHRCFYFDYDFIKKYVNCIWFSYNGWVLYKSIIANQPPKVINGKKLFEFFPLKPFFMNRSMHLNMRYIHLEFKINMPMQIIDVYYDTLFFSRDDEQDLLQNYICVSNIGDNRKRHWNVFYNYTTLHDDLINLIFSYLPKRKKEKYKTKNERLEYRPFYVEIFDI